jgi:hypothetical protein
MTGSQADMLARLKAVLPSRWFPDTTPVFDSILGSLAAGWSWVHGLYSYAAQQTRIITATDVWLDIIALDFFGTDLARRVSESDASYRVRIGQELFRPRGTRHAIGRMLTDMTGRTPVIFEPARSSDTGGYTQGGVGYGAGGGWGSLLLPYQCFVTAFRPSGSGIAQVAGWGTAAGGYGTGTIEYGNSDMVQGQVTDADITAALAGVLPAASIAWTRISN